jgi:lysophospholipase L1-like esterase
VHLLGLTAENDQPGIVVDTLGINGSRMSNQLKWHEGLWTQAIHRRDPSLVIYAFGTNETMDLHQKIGLYEQEVRDVIARLKRATPGASCLLFAPFDFPRQEGEIWKTRSRLLEILEVQKRVSQQEGCAFWDAYSYMGGPGSMRKWAMAHPPHASSDHIHLTANGYVRAAIGFTDALMRRYDAEALSGAHVR